MCICVHLPASIFHTHGEKQANSLTVAQGEHFYVKVPSPERNFILEKILAHCQVITHAIPFSLCRLMLHAHCHKTVTSFVQQLAFMTQKCTPAFTTALPSHKYTASELWQ